MDKENAEKEINRINKLRENHYDYYTEKEWRNPSNYDICINSDSVGIDNSVDLICNIVNKVKSFKYGRIALRNEVLFILQYF